VPFMSSRGKNRKYYDVRVGRKVGVFSTWEECKAVVNGVSASEFRSFPTEREAMDYVKSGRMVRTVCYMNLTPSSFVPGRAMRAVIRVVQEG
jgi:viroplasmin and RNaseH domain-containing protein